MILIIIIIYIYEIITNAYNINKNKIETEIDLYNYINKTDIINMKNIVINFIKIRNNIDINTNNFIIYQNYYDTIIYFLKKKCFKKYCVYSFIIFYKNKLNNIYKNELTNAHTNELTNAHTNELIENIKQQLIFDDYILYNDTQIKKNFPFSLIYLINLWNIELNNNNNELIEEIKKYFNKNILFKYIPRNYFLLNNLLKKILINDKKYVTSHYFGKQYKFYKFKINKINILKIINYLNKPFKKNYYNNTKIFYKLKPNIHINENMIDPKMYRYLCMHDNTIKIIDKIWTYKLKKNINVDDKNTKEIFKISFFYKSKFSIRDIGVQYTDTINNKVLLDITKAFDNVNWIILKKYLISNLKRKMNSNKAIQFVYDYMYILINKKCYLNKIKLNISNGISQGLPSSAIIFTLFMEEIIFRWMNKYKFKNNIDFIIICFIDDIYLEIINTNNTLFIINSLIEELKIAKLLINNDKSKASENLNINFLNKLTINDSYMGIFFNRNLKDLIPLINNDMKIRKWNVKCKYNLLLIDNKLFIKFEKKDIKYFNYSKKYLFYKLGHILSSNFFEKTEFEKYYYDDSHYFIIN